ncbi:MAG: TonB-dependent receptor [Acidobacteria bacterium]|nr:TonB-dependent receptor [Acidobacteriota bacterium]
MNSLSRALIVLMVLLLATANGWAQATAQINGTVADSSGAVLPGVNVIAIQTETGFRRETVTDETGGYALLNLPTGPYRIEATLSGFRTFSQTGVVLQVGSNPVIPVRMELGSLEETVSVEAAAPLVETRNPAVGATITSEQIDALPLEGRSAVSLITLTGASADAGPSSSRSMTSSRGIAISGGQAFGVAYLLDGALHNNAYDGFNMPLPFPDALQEFKVETSTQNAQNGVHAGGTVSLVTKSGTNLLHGDAFEFARHYRFNATSPFAGTNPATGERLDDGLVRNQFGGVLGGKIIQDKLFFFGAYQGSRSTQTPADLVAFIPTAAMMAGDFTAVAAPACNRGTQVTLRAPFVNNRLAAADISPAALAVSKRLPVTTDPCGRITYSSPTKPVETQTIGKIDWQINQNHSLFGRYMLTTTFWEPPFANDGNLLSTSLGGRDSDARSLAIGDTMVLSNTMVNNVRFTYHYTNVHRTHEPFFGPEDVGIKSYSYVDDITLIAVSNAFNLGLGTELDSYYRPTTYAYSDDLTWIRGSHQFGFGGSLALSDWHTRTNSRSGGSFTMNGGATGLPLADFMAGRVFEFRQANPFTNNATQKAFGVYAQDTWRVSNQITMNYGMRYEPWFPQQHTNATVYNFSPSAFVANTRSKVYPDALPGFTYPGDAGFPSKAGLKPNWMNFQPRVGVSWDPNGDGKTSIRAGYGLTGDFVAGQFLTDAMQAWPFGYEERLTGTAVGSLDDPFGGVGRVSPFPVKLGAGLQKAPGTPFIMVPQDLDGTRVHTWNVAIQRQLSDTIAVSATYLGNRMVNIWGDVNGNPAVLPSNPTGPCTLRTTTGTQTFPNCSTAPINLRREIAQANPGDGQYIGYLDWVGDQGWQRYHGVLLSGQKRAANGVSANANYTWSTCEGTAQSNTGGNPLNVGTGYSRPQSLLNPPANSKELFDLDKGPCSLSPTHIFNLIASAETPQFSSTAVRMLASGWRLSGIFRASSGAALRVVTGIDRSLDGLVTTAQRVNQVMDNVYGDKTLNNWFNPAAFAQPAIGTYGNSGYNAYLGPGTRTIDLALVRSFRFLSSQRIEARVEAFNALNWLRPQNPNATLSSPTFGQILTAYDPRVMQFGLKYEF